jgi:hypothetical protein
MVVGVPETALFRIVVITIAVVSLFVTCLPSIATALPEEKATTAHIATHAEILFMAQLLL